MKKTESTEIARFVQIKALKSCRAQMGSAYTRAQAINLRTSRKSIYSSSRSTALILNNLGHGCDAKLKSNVFSANSGKMAEMQREGSMPPVVHPL